LQGTKVIDRSPGFAETEILLGGVKEAGDDQIKKQYKAQKTGIVDVDEGLEAKKATRNALYSV